MGAAASRLWRWWTSAAMPDQSGRVAVVRVWGFACVCAFSLCFLCVPACCLCRSLSNRNTDASAAAGARAAAPQTPPIQKKVTGADSGIGLQVCRALAARGARLVLVSRDARCLAGVADDLREEFGAAAVAGVE
jgi:hypothetical protein